MWAIRGGDDNYDNYPRPDPYFSKLFNAYFNPLANGVVNIAAKNGDTAFMLAVESLQLRFALSLIRLGADINAKDNTGQTALIRLISAHHDHGSLYSENMLVMIKTLLDFHADPNITDNSGRNALTWALLKHMNRAVELLKANGATASPQLLEMATNGYFPWIPPNLHDDSTSICNSKKYVKEDRFIPDGEKAASIPGKTIGVLGVYDMPWLKKDRYRDPLWFTSGKSYYNAIYIPLDDTEAKSYRGPLRGPALFSVGNGKFSREESYEQKLALGFLSTVVKFGVSTPFTLVETVVNFGEGVPGSAGEFVASKVLVVEGSKEYPIKVTEVIEHLQTCYQNYCQAEADNINSALAKAMRQLRYQTKLPDSNNKSEQLYVTWLPETEQLQVEFYTMISDGQPSRAGDYLHHSYGVDFGISYIVSKSGRLERTEIIPISPFYNIRLRKFSDDSYRQ